MTDADLCRANGWGVGDVLEGWADEDHNRSWSGRRIQLIDIGTKVVVVNWCGSFRRDESQWASHDQYEEEIWELGRYNWTRIHEAPRPVIAPPGSLVLSHDATGWQAHEVTGDPQGDRLCAGLTDAGVVYVVRSFVGRSEK